MLTAITKLVSLTTVLIIGMVVIYLYREHSAAQRQADALADENVQLKQVVDRLTDERRVAEMLVTSQKLINGIPQTTLVFAEYARNRLPLPPKIFTIVGNQIHLDAMVIKFQRDFVKQNDPLRGHSLALFTRVYGDHQSPDQGSLIDTAGDIPGYYQGSDPRVGAFEVTLWKDFCRLANDPIYREKMGVRVSNGQGLWWPAEPGMLYTITMESDGGLNESHEPVKPIYRDALRIQNGAGL